MNKIAIRISAVKQIIWQESKTRMDELLKKHFADEEVRIMVERHLQSILDLRNDERDVDEWLRTYRNVTLDEWADTL